MIGISILNYRTAPVCILLSLVLVGCDLNFQEKKITGTVFDNFGKPIENARVSIKNSSFSALTNKSGAFRLEYVPGTFTVLLFAEGHTSRSVQLTIQEATSYPLDDTMLYRIPPSDSLHLIGTNGYIPLIPFAISKQELKSKGFMSSTFEYRLAGMNWDEDAVSSMTEALSELESGAQKGGEILVVDSTPANFKLVVLDGDRIGTSTFGPMSGNQNRTLLPEKFINIDGFSVRKPSNVHETLNEASIVCYVQFGEWLGQEVILDEKPAYCFAKTPDSLLSLYSIPKIELSERLAEMQIVPEGSLGNIRLGDSRGTIRKLLGKPTEEDPTFQRYDLEGYSLYVYSHHAPDEITGIRLLAKYTLNAFGPNTNFVDLLPAELPKIANRISLGSSQSELFEVLGSQKKSLHRDTNSKDFTDISYYYPKINFRLWNGRIQDIRIEPMPENIVQAPKADTNSLQKSTDLKSQYVSQIMGKVTSNWFRPKSTRPGMRCTVSVVQIPGGEIILPNIGNSCNADEETRKSIIAAIERTGTLPYAGFEEVFAREISLDFRFDGN